MIKKISITTPCLFLSEGTLRTAKSICHQDAVINKKINLDYKIYTTENYPDKSIENQLRELGALIIKEPDTGLYDAISKGLKNTEADIYGYLNSGDQYFSTAFDVLIEAFSIPNVKWVTGYSALCNTLGQITAVWKPTRFERKLFQCGAYCAAAYPGRPCVQQESTFWNHELNSKIDFDKLKLFKVAGDYFLWISFSRYADLYSLHSLLGAFEVREGQLSENKANYANELRPFFVEPSIYEKILLILDFKVPYKIKFKIEKIIGRKTIPSIIFSNNKWKLQF